MSSKRRVSIMAGTIQSISPPGRWTRTRRRRPISESTRIDMICSGLFARRGPGKGPRRRIVAEGRFATIRPRHADRLSPEPPLRTLRLAGDGPDLLLRPPLPHLAAVVDHPRRKRAGAGPADHRRADRRAQEDG